MATTATDAAGRFVFAQLPAGGSGSGSKVRTGSSSPSPIRVRTTSEDSDADPATGRVSASSPWRRRVEPERGRRAAGSVTGGPTIGDFAWNDLDRDGIQDPGEPGLANVTVKLRDPAGTVLATTTTDAGGLYGFTNVAPGSYRLRFAVPAGLQTTPSNVGTDDTVDCDINAGGETAVFTLVAGQTDITLDAGFAPLA